MRLDIKKYSLLLLRLRLLFLLWTLIQVAGCNWKASQTNSVLLLAVDSLPVEAVNCEFSDNLNQEEITSGMRILCQQSVRFTHAYTTSTLQQPALGSLLAGRYPTELNLWHNGEQYLLSEYETVAEKALTKKIRTSFFSGGIPIWSKSGLNQGFEVFNDQVTVSVDRYYRTSLESFHLFSQWLKNEVKKDSFFSTIYLSDLQFISQQTTNKLGKMREKSYRGQLQQLDESLFELWKNLKKMKRWDNTTIIFVGLNGRSKNNKPNEIKALNLFSENTHVALLIKPASKKRDLGLKWKVDRNVSLVDVGGFIFESLGFKIPKRRDGFLPVFSIKTDVLGTSGSSANENYKKRIILTESGWNHWKGNGKSRFSLRQGPFLYFYETKPKLYNSFADPFETSPVPSSERWHQNFYKELRPLLEAKGFLPWEIEDKKSIDKYFVATQIFVDGKINNEDYQDIKMLSFKYPQDKQIADWQANIYLNKKDWLSLKKIGEKFKQPVWKFVANFQHSGRQPKNQKGCLKLLTQQTNKTDKTHKPNFKTCADPVFVKLIQWLKQPKKTLVREQKKEEFLRSYIKKYIDTQIGRLNFQSGLTWNIDEKKSYAISDVDMILSLPPYRFVKNLINRRLKR